jgi:hypothetical protein
MARAMYPACLPFVWQASFRCCRSTSSLEVLLSPPWIPAPSSTGHHRKLSRRARSSGCTSCTIERTPLIDLNTTLSHRLTNSLTSFGSLVTSVSGGENPCARMSCDWYGLDPFAAWGLLRLTNCYRSDLEPAEKDLVETTTPDAFRPCRDHWTSGRSSESIRLV